MRDLGGEAAETALFISSALAQKWTGLLPRKDALLSISPPVVMAPGETLRVVNRRSIGTPIGIQWHRDPLVLRFGRLALAP